jgi:predicted nucleotidyltransferase
MLSWKWYTGNLDWLRGSTIFLARSGSHAYGTNLPTSDEDFRGIAIPPKRYFHGFVDRFEQAEVKDPDVVIYDVRKFFSLAADCNPNIVESLFIDESDWIIATRYWTDVVHRFRDAFLSKRAMHTFSGYAMSQLKRIRSHRRYLLNPPRKHPDRVDCGLPDAPTLARDQFGVIEARIRKTEDTLGGEGFTKDRIEEVDASLVEAAVRDLELSPNLIPIIVAERKYGAAMREWKQYEIWKTNRNDKRAELERKHGFDSKHGMHLVRLLRMAIEILRDGKVVVKRPDAEELLAIRNGAWTFDVLMEWATKTEVELKTHYETSALPREPDRRHLDGVLTGVVEMFLGYPYLGPP